MSADFFADPFSGDGVLLPSSNMQRRNWICRDKHNPDLWHMCSVDWVDPIIEANKQERLDTSGQKFGDMRKVAAWDESTYWNKVLPARLNGDDKYIRKMINDSDNAKFRTFEGKI